MKSNLRKSSLLLFCAMFFVFAFFASPGLATGRISTETTVSLESADITVDAQGIPAVLSSGDKASVTITDGLTVHTISNDSDALNALNGGKIKAGSADITTSGDNAVAVYAKSETKGVFSSVDIAGHARITTNGTANSVYADDNSEISFGSLDLTTTSGDGLQANGGGTNGAVIRVSDYATVTTSGENAIGLFANKSGNISIGGLATVTTSGKDAHGMQIRAGKRALSPSVRLTYPRTEKKPRHRCVLRHGQRG
jgi:hypothetical protein